LHCASLDKRQPPRVRPGLLAARLRQAGAAPHQQGAKAAKRHQAISGYWHTQATAARWCRNRSYLDSAAAHGIIALDAITAALASTPRLPLHAAATATGNRSSRMPVK